MQRRARCSPETPRLDGVGAAGEAERVRRSSVRQWTALLVVTARALPPPFLRHFGSAGARPERELHHAAGGAFAAALVRAPRQRWLEITPAA